MPSHYSVNKVMLIGRLGADPELRYTNTGQPRCSMNVATSYRYLDKKSNEWQDRTSWHRVVTWGKQGELIKEKLSRGRRVFVEGRLDNRSYTGKDGQLRHAQEVITDNVVFLEPRHQEGSPPVAPPEPATTAEDPPSLEEEPLPF